MTVLLLLIVAPLTLLTFCFAVELFAGVRPLPEEPRAASSGAKAVIIVPAHDEEAVIGDTLPALKAAAADLAWILVVADNCSDSTAKIARSLGVEVIERFDPDRRGKGFALDFARLHLKPQAPDVVLIVDADCVTDTQSIDRLIERCTATRRPCQAVYLLSAAPDGSPAVQLSTFAFFIKNAVRQRALQRLARRVHLVGTGMALPWELFEHAELATDNIVEDLAMGIELGDSGHFPSLVEGAAVWSDPATKRNTFAQRRRWEGGYLENAVRAGPKTLVRGLVQRDARGVWMAANLLIPPLALLILLDMIALLCSALLVGFAGARAWPALLLAGSLVLAFAGLMLAWRNGGSRFVSLGGLARIPLYLLWKLPLYLGLARRGAPKEWIRTHRS